MTDALGRLTRIDDLRAQWPGEASHFTPWLAEEDNIALLGDTLGIEMEVEAVEQNVGPFRADILAKDTATDGWVLIENQLERTDHTHLGQLMTYAAGLDAATIVWIAAKVAPDHRKAMDWLNEITDETFRFFALEIELWRIGDSLAAPKFNVICQPNDWQKSTAQGRKAVEDRSLTPLKEVYLRYWTAFVAVAGEGWPGLRFTPPKPSRYAELGMGHNAHCWCGIRKQDNTIRCGITLKGAKADAVFRYLLERKEDIEAALGFELAWDDEDGTQRCTAKITHPSCDPTDEADWPRQHNWLLQTVSALHTTFRPHVRAFRDRT